MPILIKRYRNRKLYDTHEKRYITLSEIEELVKNQEEVKVIDNDTGEEITSAVLSQIIFGSEKNKTGVLPINLLFSLVQSGGQRIDEIRRNIFNSLNLAHHYDVEIERRINLLIANGELDRSTGFQMLEKLQSINFPPEYSRESIEGKIIEIFSDSKLPTKLEFQSLVNRIESLSQRVENLKAGQTDNKMSDNTNQINA